MNPYQPSRHMAEKIPGLPAIISLVFAMLLMLAAWFIANVCIISAFSNILPRNGAVLASLPLGIATTFIFLLAVSCVGEKADELASQRRSLLEGRHYPIDFEQVQQ